MFSSTPPKFVIRYSQAVSKKPFDMVRIYICTSCFRKFQFYVTFKLNFRNFKYQTFYDGIKNPVKLKNIVWRRQSCLLYDSEP